MKIELIPQDKTQREKDVEKKRLSELKQRIRVFVLAGYSIEQVIKRLNTTKEIVNDAIKYMPRSMAEFGHKNEAYESEEFMINGYKAPVYQELSQSERKIFNSLL